MLPMFPVRLWHTSDNLSEHKDPVHLVFLDRVPWGVNFVIGDNQQLVFHLLQALNMCCLVVKECINPVTVEALDADIDKQ